MSQRPNRFDTLMLWALGAVNTALHLVFANGYGIFRDELYYLICSEHLDWGYVDHPPLSILLLWVQRTLLGDSLLALRTLPSIAAGVVVVLVGFIAREMGGGRYSQALAAVCALIMPVLLGMSSFFSMNAFDVLFWALAIWVLCRLINTGNPTWWLWFGLVAGLGLENKLSFLFLGFALAVGLALTPHRKQLLRFHLYAGAAIALALFFPHIIWQVRHQWATLEFMHNASQYKNAPTNPLQYFLDQIVMAHPLVLPIWVLGVVACLVFPSLRPYRILGIMFVTLFLLYSLTRGKAYYLAPAYPLVIGAGAIQFERLSAGRYAFWARSLVMTLLLIGGCVTAPLTLPILPPETLIAYQRALGIRAPQEEIGEPARLDQLFADRFGWPELVAGVARVYNSLSDAEKSQCSIVASNYGEAAAIDWFGGAYNLPKAICMHNNYWIWGPGDATGAVVISVGGVFNDLKPLFQQGALADVVKHPFSEEGSIPIWIFQRLKPGVAIQDIWPSAKHFI